MFQSAFPGNGAHTDERGATVQHGRVYSPLADTTILKLRSQEQIPTLFGVRSRCSLRPCEQAIVGARSESHHWIVYNTTHFANRASSVTFSYSLSWPRVDSLFVGSCLWRSSNGNTHFVRVASTTKILDDGPVTF